MYGLTSSSTTVTCALRCTRAVGVESSPGRGDSTSRDVSRGTVCLLLRPAEPRDNSLRENHKTPVCSFALATLHPQIDPAVSDLLLFWRRPRDICSSETHRIRQPYPGRETSAEKPGGEKSVLIDTDHKASACSR